MDYKLIFGFFAILATLEIFAAEDISKLMMDKAVVQAQINCAMDRGPCDDIGKQIKTLIPEALTNHCRLCTPVQAKQSRQIIQFMQQNYPWELRQIFQYNIGKMIQRRAEVTKSYLN